MNQVQRYLFNRVLRSVLIIVGGLTVLAILAQGLSQTEIIVDNRQGALTFFKIVALGVPQIVALLTPMAMFVATIWALNRLHRDSEIVVAQAAGMTRWQVASPIIRLSVLGAVVHLGVNLWIQPSAQREMRETISEARADLASSLVRPGQFTTPDANLTVFAREQEGADLIGVQIAERVGQPDARDYLAERGRFIEIDGQPAIVMFNVQIHFFDENGILNILYSDQSTFDLTPFTREDGKLVLKASDRFLHELLFIDRSSYNERRNEVEFLAEANSRLSSPLISIAMALLAALAVMGGNFSRRGYSRRIVIASGGALLLIIVQLSVQSQSGSDAMMNIGQWIVPIAAIGGLSYVLFVSGNPDQRSPENVTGSMIQRYVFMRCLMALGLVIGIFAITIMLVDVVEQLRTVGGDIDLSPLTAVQLSLMKLPGLLEETLAFAVLVAAMIAYNQLSKSSELSVIRATGQSAWQFLAPVMVMAAGLGLFAMMVLNPLGAHLSERFETTRANLLQAGGQVVERQRSDVWLRQGTDDSQIVIHAATVDSTGQVFTKVRFLEEGRIYEGARPTSRFRFTRRIDADTARISGGFWQLSNLIENTPGNPPQELASLAIETDLDPNTLLSRFTSPDTIGFWGLPSFISQTSRAGLDTSRFSMRWFGLTSLPVLYTAMALIGAIVCLRLSRLGGTSRLIAVGAGAAVALFFVTQIASSFGSSGAIPALIAAWSPALCALFISLTVLAYQEDG